MAQVILTKPTLFLAKKHKQTQQLINRHCRRHMLSGGA